ncbi:uncharacterized protein SPPG_06641 [Spizellomyces punctatus DAOM BR117]|uniref:BRO domain-containing protein 1 n=1 Tax=Spizellomyces punctatus (strain DAOM BR117) TaxID=645134 RepID=A0A0L0HBD2_SPIPD|nr:uncharacterized protein SPPG_06641 [Spizellomyces punctatus DAOM BR117]KNC98241.1 hypothetical protein SPPG_06641 [Spizellomyces punctatus DAOM BR117]|eukprot:XP_016606281.1 hypothetical protein SPPG_06641 [Spizellomyces punctatus DAOM BR117]
MAATLQSPLLHVATKRTDEVDFTGPFRNYISTVYQDDPDKYATEIATLHRLRQDTRGAGKDLTGRDILYRYYGQLELLDLRFPVDEKHVKVLFTWYDAFSQKPISQYSIAYEKACTIFNIAATCSSIGALQNRFEAAGLKMAFNYFQAAAGLFLYINDNFLHAPSLDLSRDSIKTLADLMLAQAQECFIEKVIMEKKKGALVAKLAAQAAHVYQNVADGLANEAIRSQFDRAWIELVKVKAKHFQAVAMYHKSMQSESETKYGEIVGYLTAAENIAKEANKLATAFSGSFPSFTTSAQTATSSTSSSGHTTAAAAALLEATKTSLNLITDRKNVAVKDNDMIYHDSVPKVETLPAIEKLNAVKPITFADICVNGQADIPKIIGPDIFQRLVPLSVHESASLYSEEKAKLLRSQQERVEAANGELQATLDSMNLVATLDKLKQLSKRGPGGLHDGVTVPEQVKQWNAAVREAEESGTQTDEVLGLLEGFKKKVRELLDEIGLLLDKEQHECETMRVKFVERWTQEPSAQLTSRIREDVRQHRDSFEKALATDGALMAGLEESRMNIDILKRRSEDVEAIFVERLITAAPTKKDNVANLLDENVDGGAGFGVLNEQILIEKMDGLLSRLRTLKKERNDLIDELKAKLHQDDISSLLLLNKNKESQVFQTELSKFKPLQGRITANLQAHTQFLHDLSSDFTKLGSSSDSIKSLESMEKRKEALIKEWGRSYEQWKEAKEGLARGVEFYSSLCELVESLRTTVIDFTRRRAEERDGLAKKLGEEQAEQRQRTLREQLQRLSISTTSQGAVNSPSGPGPAQMQSSPSAPVDSPLYAAQHPVSRSGSLHIHQEPSTALGSPYQYGPFSTLGGGPSMPPASTNRPDVQPFAPPPPSPLAMQAPPQFTQQFSSGSDRAQYNSVQQGQAPPVQPSSHPSSVPHNPYAGLGTSAPFGQAVPTSVAPPEVRPSTASPAAGPQPPGSGPLPTVGSQGGDHRQSGVYYGHNQPHQQQPQQTQPFYQPQSASSQQMPPPHQTVHTPYAQGVLPPPSLFQQQQGIPGVIGYQPQQHYTPSSSAYQSPQAYGQNAHFPGQAGTPAVSQQLPSHQQAYQPATSISAHGGYGPASLRPPPKTGSSYDAPPLPPKALSRNPSIDGQQQPYQQASNGTYTAAGPRTTASYPSHPVPAPGGYRPAPSTTPHSGPQHYSGGPVQQQYQAQNPSAQHPLPTQPSYSQHQYRPAVNQSQYGQPEPSHAFSQPPYGQQPSVAQPQYAQHQQPPPASGQPQYGQHPQQPSPAPNQQPPGVPGSQQYGQPTGYGQPMYHQPQTQPQQYGAPPQQQNPHGQQSFAPYQQPYSQPQQPVTYASPQQQGYNTSAPTAQYVQQQPPQGVANPPQPRPPGYGVPMQPAPAPGSLLD